MKKQEFTHLLKEKRFEDLFIELGWNEPVGDRHIRCHANDGDWDFLVVAEQGMKVLACEVETLPAASLYKSLDRKIRRAAKEYLCIYYVADRMEQMWVVPVEKAEKRELVSVEYRDEAHAEFLLEKIGGITFPLGQETNIMDVKQQVQGAFVVNSEKLTKRFYDEFRKQHRMFESFIQGIKDEGDCRWYASIMLDRLMFCYFIQKKGFLDDKPDYLSRKLKEVKATEGEDEFYGFYRDFLRHLFRQGLNTPNHDTPEFVQRFGRIPYLNGGMFDIHPLEQRYEDIQIKDEAFERLFAFFDQWEWHLDTRITSSGKDINPDVLGYIFEQFINDRAQMGAYYTKEDITGYIGRNTILPYLWGRVKERMPALMGEKGEVWLSLQNSGDEYIYPAMKKGYSANWQTALPTDIAEGLDTHAPNLLERRAHWNERTTEAFALPTEIWRESIARMQRCDEIMEKIRSGQIHDINDFITLNLNLPAFTQDILSQTSNHHLIRHFYHALKGITVLDPTCGSGAFLFAAMNILEPLYEVCIERMQDFQRENKNLFKEELGEISNRYRSNIQYFIYKSIILHNLYGVDIMEEAVEIAKLRLFLKMVAAVEVDMRADNFGLDPLPDIDFNIRTGNTLVGYATYQEWEATLTNGDIFANQEFEERIKGRLKRVSKTYDTFKWLQMNQQEDSGAFHEAKKQLNESLKLLNDELNQHLYGRKPDLGYASWLERTQPFHWFAEFYDIMQNGGFDVIIGNPPYVEYRKKKKGVSVADLYKISNYSTIDCSNLYAFVIERSLALTDSNSYISYIIPSASVCTPRMQPLSKILYERGTLWTSLWDERPSKLFDGVDQQLCIQISKGSDVKQKYITKMVHWAAEYRQFLFDYVNYIDYSDNLFVAEVAPKIQYAIEKDLIHKIYNSFKSLQELINTYNSDAEIYYRTAGGRYWKLVKSFPTYFSSERSSATTTENAFKVPSKDVALTVSILSSSLFYWYWRICSNCRHLTNREIDYFPISNDLITHHLEFAPLIIKYEESLKANKIRRDSISKVSGKIVQDFYFAKLSKPIIDEIDKVLARHYGFTDEELDFIINYDIKYRMGEELNGE